MLKMYVTVPTGCGYKLGKSVKVPNGHVTIAFGDVAPVKGLRTGALDDLLPTGTEVIGIEYWPTANVTVALLEPADFVEARGLLDGVGLTYTDHEFRPHVTIAYGSNEVEKYLPCVGDWVGFGASQLKIKDFGDA